MQRQSLGSPSSKVHLHSHGVAKEEDTDEPPKSQRLSWPPPKPNKLIHLIPLLTFLCFLILYLSSHTPSPSDLDHFTGLKISHKHDLAAEISDIGHYTDANRGDVLAIRTLRNLQQLPKSRLHRKLADF